MPLNPYDASDIRYLDTNSSDPLEALEISRIELATFAGGEKYPELWITRLRRKTRFAGFNFWAFLFGVQWFYFRKLYVQGGFSLLLEIGVPWLVTSHLISLEGMGFVAAIGGLTSALAIRVAIGYWANLALYKAAIRTIRETDELNLDNEKHLRRIAHEGGISVPSLLVINLMLGLMRVAYQYA